MGYERVEVAGTESTHGRVGGCAYRLARPRGRFLYHPVHVFPIILSASVPSWIRAGGTVGPAVHR